jgi:hypothetical protein
LGKSRGPEERWLVHSTRTLFQVYAPNELREADTLAKIDEDYLGALSHWQDHFDTWVFVHNSVQGLGPGVEHKLLDLDAGHQSVRVRWWGREELGKVVFELKEPDLASLLGPIPSRTDLINIQFPEVEKVLQTLEKLSSPQSDVVRPVPPEKLKANALSEAVAQLLIAGMVASNKIRDYFNKLYDPNLGDRVAQAFRGEYESLRNRQLPADDIFAELQRIGNGTTFATPSRQAATLTVLAYLFEACDIFERPPEEAAP